MDLSRVVRRLSEALGPEAHPDLVERAAVAVLDVARPDAPTTDVLWVAATAPAASALLMDLLAALAAVQGDVRDVVQHHDPAGCFVTLEVRTNLGAEALRERLDAVGRRHGATLAVLRPTVAAALLDT